MGSQGPSWEKGLFGSIGADGESAMESIDDDSPCARDEGDRGQEPSVEPDVLRSCVMDCDRRDL